MLAIVAVTVAKHTVLPHATIPLHMLFPVPESFPSQMDSCSVFKIQFSVPF